MALLLFYIAVIPVFQRVLMTLEAWVRMCLFSLSSSGGSTNLKQIN